MSIGNYKKHSLWYFVAHMSLFAEEGEVGGKMCSETLLKVHIACSTVHSVQNSAKEIMKQGGV